ncbi:MAG: aspartate kinase [Bdellovibrionales bacterium]|nr:aspartate kinase [Bdellovibrionales bacterium]
MKSILVQKYGGTSVASPALMQTIARSIKPLILKHRIVVVVSAMGKTTDQLLAQAQDKKITNAKDLDAFVAQGENISANTFCEVLKSMGVSACVLLGHEVPIRTNANFGSALIQTINPHNITNAFENVDVVVVPGFQGVYENHITTLGRGGSDLTAVALSVCLGAEYCEIYTDVPGVMTTDPKLYDEPRMLKHLGYDEMIAFSYAGAKVLQARCVVLAKRYGMPIVVKSSFEEGPGTWVGKEHKVERQRISGVAVKNKQTIVSIQLPQDQILNMKQALQGASCHVLSFRSQNAQAYFDLAFDHENEITKRLKEISDVTVVHQRNAACVAIVGSGLMIQEELFFDVQEALCKKNIEVFGSYLEDAALSLIISVEQSNQAVRVLHEHFHLEKEPN